MKKLTALALALLLCVNAAVALATGSIRPEDVVRTRGQVDDSAIVVTDQTRLSGALLAQIQAFIQDGKPVGAFFDDATQGEIAAALPEGFDLDTLKLDEFAPLAFTGEPFTTSAAITLATAAVYKETDHIVALAAVLGDDGSVTWQVLDVKVVNGQLVIVIPASLMQAIAEKRVVIAILSDVSA